MVPQRISEVREVEVNSYVGAIGGRNVISERERYSHSTAGV